MRETTKGVSGAGGGEIFFLAMLAGLDGSSLECLRARGPKEVTCCADQQSPAVSGGRGKVRKSKNSAKGLWLYAAARARAVWQRTRPEGWKDSMQGLGMKESASGRGGGEIGGGGGGVFGVVVGGGGVGGGGGGVGGGVGGCGGGGGGGGGGGCAGLGGGWLVWGGGCWLVLGGGGWGWGGGGWWGGGGFGGVGGGCLVVLLGGGCGWGLGGGGRRGKDREVREARCWGKKNLAQPVLMPSNGCTGARIGQGEERRKFRGASGRAKRGSCGSVLGNERWV